MGNGTGWQPDPERGDRETHRSGSAPTDPVRPTRRGGTSRVPEHGPELHRALVAATSDIDAVEDRLSTLFDRADRVLTPRSPRPSGATSMSSGELPVDDDEILDLYGNEDHVAGETDDDVLPSLDAFRDPETDAAFAELDAALASEEPDEPDPPGADYSAARGVSA